MTDRMVTGWDLMAAVEQERDDLRVQLAQLDQANVTLSGQNTDLGAEVERLESEVVAEHELNRSAMAEIKRLQAALRQIAGYPHITAQIARATLGSHKDGYI